MICQVVDVVGAGDSFQAALLKCLLGLDNMKEALLEIEEFEFTMLSFAAADSAQACMPRCADLPVLSAVEAAPFV